LPSAVNDSAILPTMDRLETRYEISNFLILFLKKFYLRISQLHKKKRYVNYILLIYFFNSISFLVLLFYSSNLENTNFRIIRKLKHQIFIRYPRKRYKIIVESWHKEISCVTFAQIKYTSENCRRKKLQV